MDINLCTRQHDVLMFFIWGDHNHRETSPSILTWREHGLKYFVCIELHIEEKL